MNWEQCDQADVGVGVGVRSDSGSDRVGYGSYSNSVGAGIASERVIAMTSRMAPRGEHTDGYADALRHGLPKQAFGREGILQEAFV